jgi:hypothetical protein
MTRQGAYVRGVIKRRIRRVANPDKRSKPGQSPYTHEGTLKNSVLFAVEDNNVVVGPARSWIGDIAELHEYGGTVRRMVTLGWDPNQKFRIGDVGPVSVRRYRKAYASQFRPMFDPLNGSPVAYVKIKSQTQAEHASRLHRRIALSARKSTLVKYPARPFVNPGFESAQPKLAQMWAGQIK